MDLFDYQLPQELIAQSPASPRDTSRLFVYDTAKDCITLDHFRNLHRYLPKNSLLVLNETAVLPCRVEAKTEKATPIELLVMSNEWTPQDPWLKATVNKSLKPGEKIFTKGGHVWTVLESHEKVFKFKVDFPLKNLPTVLRRIGEMPVPKYIAHCPLTESEKRRKYQTIFAHTPGSVAAPTASLHFTPRVFQKLAATGVQTAQVTLHVGLGTFGPLLPEHLSSGHFYEEFYQVPKTSAEHIQAHDGPVIAVGTTSVRTLETWAKTGQSTGKTDLLITPPFEFKRVDGLLTNFHIPQSSLMRLVEAFLQHKGAKRHLKDLYAVAIQEKFRFYSFGDAMLLL